MDIRDLLKADHQAALEPAYVTAESAFGNTAKRAHQKLRAAGKHFSAQQRKDMGLHFKAHKGEPAMA